MSPLRVRICHRLVQFSDLTRYVSLCRAVDSSNKKLPADQNAESKCPWSALPQMGHDILPHQGSRTVGRRGGRKIIRAQERSGRPEQDGVFWIWQDWQQLCCQWETFVTPAFSASQWSEEGLMDPTRTGGIYRFSWLPGEGETFCKGVLPGGLTVVSGWPHTYRYLPM